MKILEVAVNLLVAISLIWFLLVTLAVAGTFGQYGWMTSITLWFIIAVLPIAVVWRIRGWYKKKQRSKGLIKYKGKWGTPEQVMMWKQEDFEQEQREKGLVKYEGEWITPWAKEQREREKMKSKPMMETITKERVLVKCEYCGGTYDILLDRCPHCGALRR